MFLFLFYLKPWTHFDNLSEFSEKHSTPLIEKLINEHYPRNFFNFNNDPNNINSNPSKNFLHNLKHKFKKSFSTFTNSQKCISHMNYFSEKKFIKNFSILIYYLLEKNDQKKDYNEGVNILNSLWNEVLSMEINKKLMVKNNDKRTIEKVSFNDKDINIINTFFEKLYIIFFTEEEKKNLLTLCSQIIINPSRDVFNAYIPKNKKNVFNLVEYMDTAAAIFKFKYYIDTDTKDDENPSVFVYFLSNSNKVENIFLLNIHLENNSCYVTFSNKQSLSIYFDKKYSVEFFLHELAHFIHYQESNIDLINHQKNLILEFYPLCVESSFLIQKEHQRNYYSHQNTYFSLLTYTFLHHLKDFINKDIFEFKNAYINTFSKDHQKLLTIIEKNNNNFYEKIKDFISNKITTYINPLNMDYLLSEILKNYCLKHNIDELEELRKNSYSLSDILNYLKLTPEDLAEYAYNYFYNNLRSL